MADEILRDHEAIVRRAIGAYGGAEVAFLGDGFMATFGTPAAGLSCAIAIQQALQSYGRDNADRRIRVRIGLHTGDAVHRDGTLYGQAVHVASRVMSEAVGGQVLVTAAVRDPVEATGTLFVDRGLYWLRGFPDRRRLYELEWGRDDAGRAAGPVQTPFVGRERERADLRRAVEDTRLGHGSLVLVSGEAGVGKTRLIQEIDAEADARGLRVLVGHSTRDAGRAPYLPFTEMVEQGMVTPRSPETLRQALGEAAPEIARIAPQPCDWSSPTSRPRWTSPRSRPAATCGSACGSSSGGPPPTARCCSSWRTCTGPTSRPCCCSSTSPCTWPRCR